MHCETGNVKFNAMLNAALESIQRRQDRHATGGIVESDLAVYNGFCYGWREPDCHAPIADTCYPRSHIGYTFVRLGLAGRLKKALDYFAQCQADDGSFDQRYFVDDPRRLHRLYPNLKAGETDGTGYILWHMQCYHQFAGDQAWLEEKWPVIEKGAGCLLRSLDPDTGLIPGNEELILAEPGGSVDMPGGYMAQVNGATWRGLMSAGALAEAIGQVALAQKCRRAARKLYRAMGRLFWSEEEQRHLMGVSVTGQAYRAASLFILFPAYSGRYWGGREHRTLEWLWQKLRDRDPMIPAGLWDAEYPPEVVEQCKKYSGCGVTIGKHPVWIELLMRDGATDRADELLRLTLDLTDDSNLIAEHLNTISLGRELDPAMRLWPHPTALIDRGNLMHLTFFLQLACSVIGIEEKDSQGVLALRPQLLPALEYVEVRDWPVSPEDRISFRAEWRSNRTQVVRLDTEQCGLPVRLLT